MGNEIIKLELKEVMNAGERALCSLKIVQKELEHAKKWGIIDLFGGGFFVNIVKHSKIKNSSFYMETAKRDLRIFQRELNDVQMFLNLNLNIGDFLTFADFFFDGLITDYLVQSKINEARKQVWTAIKQVEKFLIDLQKLYDAQNDL